MAPTITTASTAVILFSFSNLVSCEQQAKTEPEHDSTDEGEPPAGSELQQHIAAYDSGEEHHGGILEKLCQPVFSRPSEKFLLHACKCTT